MGQGESDCSRLRLTWGRVESSARFSCASGRPPAARGRCASTLPRWARGAPSSGSSVSRWRREAPAGWEARARETFLDAYLHAVDPALLPAGRGAIDRLLSVFELEKAVYELRYEMNNRPDWVAIPAAAIRRLLEAS